jgi:hypothetical protein
MVSVTFSARANLDRYGEAFSISGLPANHDGRRRRSADHSDEHSELRRLGDCRAGSGRAFHFRRMFQLSSRGRPASHSRQHATRRRSAIDRARRACRLLGRSGLQQTYADRLRVDGPYTPQMVVDGNFQFVGSDRERANQAFEKARALPKVMIKISSLKVENGTLRAHIETDALPSPAEVFIALALDHAQSQVLHGENGGHRLEHVAVVRNLVKLGNASRGETFSKDLSLAVTPDQPYRLIAFVQELKQGKILGAAVERVQK